MSNFVLFLKMQILVRLVRNNMVLNLMLNKITNVFYYLRSLIVYHNLKKIHTLVWNVILTHTLQVLLQYVMKFNKLKKLRNVLSIMISNFVCNVNLDIIWIVTRINVLNYCLRHIVIICKKLLRIYVWCVLMVLNFQVLVHVLLMQQVLLMVV